MDWPSRGADNENVWAEMVRLINEPPSAKNEEELWGQVQAAWQGLGTIPARDIYWQGGLEQWWGGEVHLKLDLCGYWLIDMIHEFINDAIDSALKKKSYDWLNHVRVKDQVKKEIQWC